MERSAMTVYSEQRQQESLKTGAMRSKDGSLPAVESGATKCALKILHWYCADAPYRESRHFNTKGHLHTAKPFRL